MTSRPGQRGNVHHLPGIREIRLCCFSWWKTNGLTAPATDVGDLADSFTELRNNEARCAEMGANARRIALEEHSLELQARRYAELYASVV